MEAADKSTERLKWNEGCYRVRRQLHFSPRCPTMGSRFRARHVSLPGREAGIAHRPLLWIQLGKGSAMLYRASELPGALHRVSSAGALLRHTGNFSRLALAELSCL